MHPSLRVYIQYTGLCDGIDWLHNNHTQYKIVYNKQSKYDRQCYEQTCLTEMPPAAAPFGVQTTVTPCVRANPAGNPAPSAHRS